MSLTSDIRSYADKGLEQGKAVLDQAQAQLNDVTGQANEFVTKLQGTVKENVAKLQSSATATAGDLRTQAEKAVNVEAIKAAVEPYLAQAKGYSTTVTERAEDLYSAVRHDKRVAALVARAEEIVETVQERVVKPVQARTGLGVTKPAAKPTARPTAAKATPAKAASTRPAAKKTAAKPAAKKAAAK